MPVTQAQFDADLASYNSAVEAYIAAVDAFIALPPVVDLSAEDASVQAALADVVTAQGKLPPPPPPVAPAKPA